MHERRSGPENQQASLKMDVKDRPFFLAKKNDTLTQRISNTEDKLKIQCDGSENNNHGKGRSIQ